MRNPKEPALVTRPERSFDPFNLMRQMTMELDRLIDEPVWSFRRPLLRRLSTAEPVPWYPNVDVFERGGRLVTRIDLPGMKKEDVKIEVADGQLAISGERKREEQRARVRQLLPFGRTPGRHQARRREGDVCRRRARSQHSVACRAGSESPEG
jgi:HSP20 family molecular chaperone IbpA